MIEVHAVKDKATISAVSLLLNKHHGLIYADIWNLGINLALRISDLLDLKIADCENKDALEIVEGKTKKRRRIKLNTKALEIIARRAHESPNSEYLFMSTSNRAHGLDRPLTRQAVGRAFKEVGDIVDVRLGTHSMRKTRGYQMLKDGVPLSTITKMMMHSNTSVTLRYVGIEQEDIDKTYEDYVL